jgi:group II intron reverse transcriptase/maturase
MRDKRIKFTALLHHITPELLKDSYFGVNPYASPGVDGIDLDEFKEDYASNIDRLHLGLQNGTYRAQPSLRAYIPKADGGQRPLGIAAVDDKIAQRAVAEVLSAIYEVDFLDCSYGFRPERNCHDALDKLYLDITTRRVNWVVDADIKSFFDSISHDWMVRFLEHRIADQRILRLIEQWLKAGVMEEGNWKSTEKGAAQGSSISPLLANVFLHYALDLWVSVFVKNARGEMYFVRYADDFVMCAQYKDDAVRFLESLKERLAKFGLELHPDKTRLIEFGRFAAENRRKRGLGKPETFDFLGFTHSCSVTRFSRKFKLLRKTISKRWKSKLVEIYNELKYRINHPLKVVGKWLRSVVRGYFNYFAIHDNLDTLGAFRASLLKLWFKVIRRRSHKARMTWERFLPIADKYIPLPEIVHPYPSQRMASKIQSRSPVR